MALPNKHVLFCRRFEIVLGGRSFTDRRTPPPPPLYVEVFLEMKASIYCFFLVQADWFCLLWAYLAFKEKSERT